MKVAQTKAPLQIKRIPEPKHDNTPVDIPTYFCGILKAEKLENVSHHFVQYKVVGPNHLEKNIIMDSRLMASLSD